MTIQFSRRLAIFAAIIAPLAETIRRWSTWQQSPPNLFDDYIMGGSCSMRLGAQAKMFVVDNVFSQRHGLSHVG